jgi:hypothetical protein
MKKVVAAICVILTSPVFAAGSSVPWSMGGRFPPFDAVVAQYNQSGELFRIEGHCQSACTLFLAIRNVCIEPGATLLFHAGGRGEVSASATEHMLGAYNGALRGYVTAHHYMDTLQFHAISGRDMIRQFGYRACFR